MTGTRLFGTDGVRGVAGVELTADLASGLGAAATRFARARGADRPLVVVGRDTRESGPMLEAGVVAGVAAAGGRTLSAGVLPTPGVAVLARLDGADLACVVSASHNPYRDNGIKFLHGDGTKLADAHEAAIEAAMDGAAEPGAAAEPLARAPERYLDWLCDTFPGAIDTALAVGVDCANGAAAEVGPELLRRRGLAPAAIGVAPDGRNINRGVGSTHLEAIHGLLAERGLDLGIAFDGDADRCLAVAGDGRVLDGDTIVAVLALHRKREGRLPGDRVVVTSMTNLGFHRLMREHGIEVEVTGVGDRYVLERMRAIGAVLGGEQSGHVVDLERHTTGDGLATALMLLEGLAALGLGPREAASLITPFPQRLVSVPADRSRLAGADRIWEEVRAIEADLGGDGRVVLRASGTEPIVRVMVEAADAGECERLCDKLVGLVQAEIGE
jgi:phosphoglucosamine mutase